MVFCSRSVSGVDVDPDLVHMEMQDSSGGNRLDQYSSDPNGVLTLSW